MIIEFRDFIFTQYVKKFALACLIILFNNPESLAQFSFRVFPMGVGGDPYADTILNTRAILIKAGVKKIEAHQTLPEVTKTFATKTVKLNQNGSIDKMTICFAKNESSNFTLCLDDTILYDDSGRKVSVKTTDNKRNVYPQNHIEYVEGDKENNSFMKEYSGDSLVVYSSFNDKGQVTNLRRIWKEQEVENTSFYYNPDGLLDSTINTQWGTFIFNRIKKGKNKLIEMANSLATYRWVYNLSGQCIRSLIIGKTGPDTGLKTDINYYYNQDGTLNKVVTKNNKKATFIMYYSYSK